MELRQLEHFVTTADFGSTRRAAETLYTSQSSVSKNISMLEEELGVTLFVRSNRGVSLTEAGREFYDQAHAILQNVRLMKQMGRQKKYKKLNTPPAKAGGFTVATKVAFRLKPVWPLLKQAEVIPPQFGRFHLHLPVA